MRGYACGIGCFLILAISALCQTPDVQNVIVYSNPAEFAGWPANEGIWQWGDEILVGFEVSAYSEHSDNHNVDREATKRIAFARSLDGGLTWTPEEHLEIAPPEYIGDPTRYVQKREGVAEPIPSPGGFDFADPNFALKARGHNFYVSSDRGHHWQGPYMLPRFDQKILTARTNYLTVDANTCQLFYSATNTALDEGEYGRTLMAETTDGGKTFQLVSWLTPDPRELLPNTPADIVPAFSLMPSVTRLGDGTIVAAMRDRNGRHKWNHLVASTDNGRTWEDRGIIVDNNNNPIAMVCLGGQRLAVAYGYRGEPFGLRGKISEDGGRSWSQEYILRDDGREWDLGYPRAVVRSDGRIVIVYYYTTEQTIPNHIAATIWNPPAAPDTTQE